jgi:LysR family glycine cleavage system transcriptional activator
MLDGANSKISAAHEAGSQTPATPRRRLPPLKALLAFEAAARHASFTQAAAELHVTPSAISHQVQALETFLGVRLFLRQSGHVGLTPAGDRYRMDIAAALDAVAAATQQVAPQARADRLLVLSSPGFATKWLQPRLPGFIAAQPGLRVRLATMDGSQALQGTAFDIAICYGAPSQPELQVVLRLDETVQPLCSPSLVAALQLRGANDLTRATLIHAANAVTWDAVLRGAGLVGLRPSNEIWLDRSAMAIDAAVAGLGVALESDLLADADLREGRLLAPFGDAMRQRRPAAYAVVTPRARRVDGATTAFIAWLAETLGRTAEG